jgi:hypothetical protein
MPEFHSKAVVAAAAAGVLALAVILILVLSSGGGKGGSPAGPGFPPGEDGSDGLAQAVFDFGNVEGFDVNLSP